MTEPNRLAPAAVITLILGVIDLVRWVPEKVGSDRILVVAVFDLAVGVLAIVGGAGLWRRQPDRWKFAAQAWGALAASSGLFGGGMVEAFLHPHLQGHTPSELFWQSIPRASFYGLALATFPYVVWTVLTHPKAERPTLRRMGLWFMMGALTACAVGYVVLGMDAR